MIHLPTEVSRDPDEAKGVPFSVSRQAGASTGRSATSSMNFHGSGSCTWDDPFLDGW